MQAVELKALAQSSAYLALLQGRATSELEHLRLLRLEYTTQDDQSAGEAACFVAWSHADPASPRSDAAIGGTAAAGAAPAWLLDPPSAASADLVKSCFPGPVV